MKALFLTPKPYLAIGVFTLLVTYLVAGQRGTMGVALGLTATAFDLIALWGVIRLLGTAMGEGAKPSLANALLVMALFIKLPLFIFLAKWAQQLGPTANSCFLAGIGVVYFSLVAWALAKS